MDLLDFFTEALGLTYLSDLHSIVITPEQQAELAQLSERDFSLIDYNCAASYILNTPAAFETICDAKQAMITRLSQPRE